MNIEDSYQDVTVVPPSAVALIVREDGEMELAIPKDEDAEWHPSQMALAQLAMKFLNDHPPRPGPQPKLTWARFG